MLRSLRARNIALLVGVVLLGQALTMGLVAVLVIRPQAERVASIVAHNVAAISLTLDGVPEPQRAMLIERINAGGAIRILPAASEPPQDRGVSTVLEAIFIRAFVREMNQRETVVWLGGFSGQLWARVRLGNELYWVSYERPSGWSPTGALAASVLVAVALALFTGLILQRRLGAPLKGLAEAADTLRRDQVLAPLPVDGPLEIAAVAHSFNRMAERLAAAEAERTFMLAGISHDLRTPLAKIRLGLALSPRNDAETEAMLERQFSRLDEMLGQFLDFARGDEAEPVIEIDLIAIVRAAIDDVDSSIAFTPHNEQSSIVVSAHPLSLRRAIINLLRNAISHGLPPIMVQVSISETHATITVSDAGHGVEASCLATIDQPFIRGDVSRGSAGGTGLGLAIARRIAQAHGGELVLANLPAFGFAQSISLRRHAV